jgi:SSS family solute:Na+ symporter
MASVILAGFLLPGVSATGAKAGLFFGLIFYITTYFLLQVDLHFVHLWGIEFVLNILVMLLVSRYYPPMVKFVMQDAGKVALQPWKYARAFSLFLVGFTIILYLFLGNV